MGIYLGSNKIGKIYLGSHSIGKAYIGDNLVFHSGSSPQPVYQIPYIRGGADGSYIDTGITADNNTRVIVWARNFNPISGFLFGSRIAIEDGQFAISSHGGTPTGRIRLDYANAIAYADGFANLSHYHKYELDMNTAKVDGETIAIAETGTFSNNLNIHLFGLNNNGTHDATLSPMDICACKIYKGNVLVRDYTVVDSPSVGLYDSVTDMVFTNAGSGSFTYGTFNKNAYTQLEYIECSGNQYFDSGVYGKYSEGIVVKFRPTNTTAAWTSVVAYRNSTNSCDISLGTATSGEDNMRCYWRFGANNTSGAAYQGTTSTKLTGKDIIAVKTNATLTLYRDSTQIGTNAKTGVSSSFVTNETMVVGALKQSDVSSHFIGRLYYVGFGASANYVPAKVGNVAGMYDTYNDVFKESATSTPFIIGSV